MTSPVARAMPSPLPPTDAELAAWAALTREEQVARYQEYLAQPDCDRVSDDAMPDILAEARRRAATRQGG